jgi:hypothetical protein
MSIHAWTDMIILGLTNKKEEPPCRQRSQAKNGMGIQKTCMSIILYLGSGIKEYKSESDGIIKRLISGGSLPCEKCLKPLKLHSTYQRGIKETGQEIMITMVHCGQCKIYHALLPDFLLPNKHYGANEIEGVVIDGQTEPVSRIDTAASESTVRRWLAQIGTKLRQAAGILRYLFGGRGRVLNETAITPGPAYHELEQLLGLAPYQIKYSGNKLGLANIWLGTNTPPMHI